MCHFCHSLSLFTVLLTHTRAGLGSIRGLGASGALSARSEMCAGDPQRSARVSVRGSGSGSGSGKQSAELKRGATQTGKGKRGGKSGTERNLNLPGVFVCFSVSHFVSLSVLSHTQAQAADTHAHRLQAISE